MPDFLTGNKVRAIHDHTYEGLVVASYASPTWVRVEHASGYVSEITAAWLEHVPAPMHSYSRHVIYLEADQILVVLNRRDAEKTTKFPARLSDLIDLKRQDAIIRVGQAIKAALGDDTPYRITYEDGTLPYLFHNLSTIAP